MSTEDWTELVYLTHTDLFILSLRDNGGSRTVLRGRDTTGEAGEAGETGLTSVFLQPWRQLGITTGTSCYATAGS